MQKIHNVVIVDGKSVGYENDALSCSTKLIPQQSHTVEQG